MDLKERTNHFKFRHPWELARLRAIERIVGRVDLVEDCAVLDMGVGDGFLLKEVFGGRRGARLVGVDVNLTDRLVTEEIKGNPSIELSTSLSEIENPVFDLLLLLDVLEHVEDDRSFLEQLVRENLKNSGKLIITVPAFGFLFGAHDRFLEHYRRYGRPELLELIRKSGLTCLCSGYLFGSLLPLRMISVLVEKLTPLPRVSTKGGIGQWNHTPMLTKTIELLLQADNRMLMALGDRKIIIPGLTGWALCKKQ